MVLTSPSSFQRDITIQDTRIDEVSSYVESFERDSKQALRIAGVRGLVGLTEYAKDNEISKENFEPYFEEILINGSVDDETLQIMENASLKKWTESNENLFDKKGADASITIKNITIEQKNAWNILVEATVSYEIEDRRDDTIWRSAVPIRTTIGVEGLKDPLFTTMTDGDYENIIVESEEKDIQDIAVNQSYIQSEDAPSYIQRFYADELDKDQYKKGIESLVNIISYSNAGFSAENQSIIDWQFLMLGKTSYCTPTSEEWIRIDEASTERYNVEC